MWWHSKLSCYTVDSILIVASGLLYALNNLLIKRITTGIVGCFFIGYFNDLICPLLFLPYVNFMVYFLNKRIVNIWHILLICFLCGIVWEWIAPLLKPNSVTDIFDDSTAEDKAVLHHYAYLPTQRIQRIIRYVFSVNKHRSLVNVIKTVN